MSLASDTTSPSIVRLLAGFSAGLLVGLLGGLIGLGGAEFRLPLLLLVFGFGALQAVILNKATSLVVVATALVFRSGAVPPHLLTAHWPVILNLLAGTLVGAWFAAGWATHLKRSTLQRVIAVLLVMIALVLLLGDEPAVQAHRPAGVWRVASGVLAGLAIGAVSSLLGVAGGELLIPTLLLLYGLDIKLAGSLALAISLPTMLVGFARYRRDRSFVVLRDNRDFVLTLAAGSVLGAAVGGLWLGAVPAALLVPSLAAILVVSALKTWQQA